MTKKVMKLLDPSSGLMECKVSITPILWASGRASFRRLRTR